MATADIYIDVTNESFIRSTALPYAVKAPVFYASDSRVFTICLTSRTSASEVTAIDTTGVTIQVGIGTPAYTPTLITSVTSGAADANGFFSIALAFTATAIQTALGTATEITPTMEIKIIGASDPRRIRLPCTIRQRLLT